MSVFDDLDRTVKCGECGETIECKSLQWGWGIAFYKERIVIAAEGRKKEKITFKRHTSFKCPQCTGAYEELKKADEKRELLKR